MSSLISLSRPFEKVYNNGIGFIYSLFNVDYIKIKN